jgi:hypothetical protein
MNARQASIVLLLAQQRSGTHLLRSILGRNRRIAAPAEICNATADLEHENELSFFKFRHAHLIDGMNSPYPTFENQEYLVKGYLQHIASHYSDHDYVICDIKYSHVHNFNVFSWDFSSRPFLLQYAWKHGIKVVHLVRENIFQTAISDFYARQSGVWRANNQEQLKNINVTVDGKWLRRRMTHIGRTISLFDGWLLGCNSIRITYEALSGSLPEAPLALISAFLGLDEVIPFRPGFVKITPPYEDCIVNWNEIKQLGAAYGK